MDGIIDTVSAVHPLLPLIDLLKSHGKLVMVGAPNRPLELPIFPLLMGKQITPPNLCSTSLRIMVHLKNPFVSTILCATINMRKKKKG